MLGEIRKNTRGTEMIVISQRSVADIDVEFLDDHHYIKKNTTYSNFKRGNIRNPYDKTVFDIGYLGDGIYQTKYNNVTSDDYRTWKNLLHRCYVNQKDFPSYYGISTVASEWLNFQNFAKWYEEYKYECEGRLHLDKDILYPGNKVYSSYHCILVPQRINMLFANKPNNRGLPNGIYKDGNRYHARYNEKELGGYETIDAAYTVYAKAKKDAIVQVAEEYKDKIPAELYNALLNYEVRIENDKNWSVA